MKNLNKKTIVLLVAAAVLLLSSAVGSTRAALTYYSENYSAEVTVANIGVTLLENGEAVSYKNYLNDGKWDVKDSDLFADLLDKDFTVGKSYDEVLEVKNSGAIDTYVRVILTKTWIDEKGNVDQTLDPALIELPVAGEGWVVDKAASTPERTVLYYTSPLAVGDTTSAFTSKFSVNPMLQTKVVEEVKETEAGKTITYTYEYDGYSFNVEAEVDAVQTHNAAEAIKSAWGICVTVADNGAISLQ